MDWNRHLCIIIYSLVLIQCTITLVITYIKVKKSAVLYALCATMLLSMMWLILGMNEMQSESTAELFLTVRFTMLPVSLISGTWLIFALLYTGLIKPHSKWIYWIIMTPLVITYLPMMTKKYYHLSILYKNYEDTATTLWGPWQEMNYSISYTYMAISILILIIYSIRTYRYNRYRVLLLGFAPLIPVIIAFLGWHELIPEVGFDMTPVTFSIMLSLQSVATFRYSAFDQIHQGAMDVFRNTDEGLLIIDELNRIVDFNTAANHEFKSIYKNQASRDIIYYLDQLKSYTLDDSSINGIITALKDGSEKHRAQIRLSVNKNQRYYDFYLKSIYNTGGRSTARLISFKNRTEESKELLEAAHRRISRDIHDGLSNLVNVIGMNLEYVLTGKASEEETMNCVEVAFTTNNRMRFEIRRILDELVPLDIEKNGLLNALKSLFKRVTGTGLRIEFTPIGINDNLDRDLKAGLLLYSTCLEGINNAMYNGKASHVSIVITQTPDFVRLILSDDGCGCDEIIPGRGLEGITHRVNDYGGKVIFDSVLSEGFSITMELAFGK